MTTSPTRLTLLDEVRFSSVFSFTYLATTPDGRGSLGAGCSRPGRAGASRPPERPPAGAAAPRERGMVGKVLEVLVEGSDKKGLRVSGRSPFNHLVNIDGIPGTPAGTFVRVVVEKGTRQLAHSPGLCGSNARRSAGGTDLAS